MSPGSSQTASRSRCTGCVTAAQPTPSGRDLLRRPGPLPGRRPAHRITGRHTPKKPTTPPAPSTSQASDTNPRRTYGPTHLSCRSHSTWASSSPRWSASGPVRSGCAPSAPRLGARAACGSALPMPTTSTTRPAPPPSTPPISPCMKSRTCCSAIGTWQAGTNSSASWRLTVDQALIQLILGRSAYGTAEEREAETLASHILSSTATC